MFTRDLQQKSYNNNFVIPGLPIWTSNYNSAITTSRTLPYKVYGVKFYNMKQHNGRAIGIFVNKEPLVKGFFALGHKLNQMYELHCYDKYETKYGLAAITSYKQSVMLNSLFRHIRKMIIWITLKRVMTKKTLRM